FSIIAGRSIVETYPVECIWIGIIICQFSIPINLSSEDIYSQTIDSLVKIFGVIPGAAIPPYFPGTKTAKSVDGLVLNGLVNGYCLRKNIETNCKKKDKGRNKAN